MVRAERSSHGFTLPELLVAAAVMGLLAVLAMGASRAPLAQLKVESASRRLLIGLEQGRAAARRRGEACALQLGPAGWRAPATAALPACLADLQPLEEGLGDGGVQLEHNLPAAVRFSSNGLVLDGGTVLVSAPGSALTRCLVVSLPLGVVRLGRFQQGSCLPDRAL
jgi:prepilin-type N-terminal cleavage/methylation domain-containing protein